MPGAGRKRRHGLLRGPAGPPTLRAERGCATSDEAGTQAGLQPLPGDLTARAGRNAPPLRAYYFFLERLRDGATFTVDDLARATGWSGQTPRTYITKFWRQVLDVRPGGHLAVNSRFRRTTLREFMEHFTQSSPLLGSYRRSLHPYVVTYEFLLPLAKENELRTALDRLFYLDTVKQRVAELGHDQVAALLPPLEGETADAHALRITQVVGDYFGGYSISHVQGRFRASADLLTRRDAGLQVAESDRYLVDETTASVRFLIPLDASRVEFGEAFGSVIGPAGEADQRGLPAEAQAEIGRVRALFFGFFVEAVVDTVRREDEIWLIERTPAGEKLYRWESQFAGATPE